MSQDSERKARKAQTAKAKQKEGSGAVPNVTEEQRKDKVGELKNAIHEYRREKRRLVEDWRLRSHSTRCHQAGLDGRRVPAVTDGLLFDSEPSLTA